MDFLASLLYARPKPQIGLSKLPLQVLRSKIVSSLDGRSLAQFACVDKHCRDSVQDTMWQRAAEIEFKFKKKAANRTWKNVYRDECVAVAEGKRQKATCYKTILLGEGCVGKTSLIQRSTF